MYKLYNTTILLYWLDFVLSSDESSDEEGMSGDLRSHSSQFMMYSPLVKNIKKVSKPLMRNIASNLRNNVDSMQASSTENTRIEASLRNILRQRMSSSNNAESSERMPHVRRKLNLSFDYQNSVNEEGQVNTSLEDLNSNLELSPNDEFNLRGRFSRSRTVSEGLSDDMSDISRKFSPISDTATSTPSFPYLSPMKSVLFELGTRSTGVSDNSIEVTPSKQTTSTPTKHSLTKLKLDELTKDISKVSKQVVTSVSVNIEKFNTVFFNIPKKPSESSIFMQVIRKQSYFFFMGYFTDSIHSKDPNNSEKSFCDLQKLSSHKILKIKVFSNGISCTTTDHFKALGYVCEECYEKVERMAKILNDVSKINKIQSQGSDAIKVVGRVAMQYPLRDLYKKVELSQKKLHDFCVSIAMRIFVEESSFYRQFKDSFLKKMEEMPEKVPESESPPSLALEEDEKGFNLMEQLAKLKEFNLIFTSEKDGQIPFKKTIDLDFLDISLAIESKEKDVYCTSAIPVDINDIEKTEITNFMGKQQNIQEYFNIIKDFYDPISRETISELKFVILTILLSAKSLYVNSISKIPKAEIYDLPVTNKADVQINLYVFYDNQNQLFVNDTNQALGCIEIRTDDQHSPKILMALLDIPSISKFIDSYTKSSDIDEVKWFIKNKKQFVTKFGNVLDFIGMEFSPKKLETFAEDVVIEYQTLNSNEVQEMKFFLKIPIKDTEHKHIARYKHRLIRFYQQANISSTFIIIAIILIILVILILSVKLSDRFLKEKNV
ncbi:hypothetical protein NUSPORA_02356 [Nucleospora cyclopteri]